MQGASFMLDALAEVVSMVMHDSHSAETFFCSGGREFVVVLEVYAACIKAIETSVRGEFVHSGGCSIIAKFCER